MVGQVLPCVQQYSWMADLVLACVQQYSWLAGLVLACIQHYIVQNCRKFISIWSCSLLCSTISGLVLVCV